MYQKQRVIIFIIFTIAVVCMSACGQKKDIKKYADMVAQAVNTNNMTDLQSIVMKNYTSNITSDEELADFFSDFQNENDGLIKKIIERDNVKVKNIKDNFNTGYKQNFKQYNNKLNKKEDSIYYKDEDGNEYWHGMLIPKNEASIEEQKNY